MQPSSPLRPGITNNADVRYLGKLLGDVIRGYGGQALYDRTEYIRRASVDRYRGVAGADTVDTGLDTLNLGDTVAFVRGFMLFSMLANLAEDRQTAAAGLQRDRDVGGVDKDCIAVMLLGAIHSLIAEQQQIARVISVVRIQNDIDT